jgi:hypothetical protein
MSTKTSLSVEFLGVPAKRPVSVEFVEDPRFQHENHALLATIEGSGGKGKPVREEEVGNAGILRRGSERVSGGVKGLMKSLRGKSGKKKDNEVEGAKPTSEPVKGVESLGFVAGRPYSEPDMAPQDLAPQSPSIAARSSDSERYAAEYRDLIGEGPYAAERNDEYRYEPGRVNVYSDELEESKKGVPYRGVGLEDPYTFERGVHTRKDSGFSGVRDIETMSTVTRWSEFIPRHEEHGARVEVPRNIQEPRRRDQRVAGRSSPEQRWNDRRREEERAEQPRNMGDKAAERKSREQRLRDRRRPEELGEEWRRAEEKLAQVRDVRGYIPFPREPR